MSEIQPEYKNIKQRDEYFESIMKFTDRLTAAGNKNRRINPAEKETLRKQFVDVLGYPLNCYDKYKNEEIEVKTEFLAENADMVMTRYQLEIMPDFWFSGILYEPKDNGEEKQTETEKCEKCQNNKNALVIAQHGGGGSSEIVGSLVFESANYNHMVKRVIRKGITVFAPQLLLWDCEVYGNTGYNRFETDQRLKQFGGSITALEIFCIMRAIDYFSGLDFIDENKIGMIGLSYGGMYALYTAAADVRIKSALSSCWFGQRLYHMWADWMYFNQLNIFSDEEVGRLVLPRKLYIEIGRYDEMFTAENAQPYLERVAEYAKSENCVNSLKTKIFDGAHELDKSADGIKFFIENLLT